MAKTSGGRCYLLAPLGRLGAEAEASRLDRLVTDARRRHLLGSASPALES